MKLLLFISFLFPLFLHAQTSEQSLFRAIKQQDSLLFNVGFNNCNIQKFEDLLSVDFEFYHDEAGITDSKAAFIDNVRNGLCRLDYKPRRELVPGSMTVFPLKKTGVLYGAVQQGEHRFYALEKGKPEYLTSIALFTNLWLLENGSWKLSRSLSFDHRQK